MSTESSAITATAMLIVVIVAGSIGLVLFNESNAPVPTSRFSGDISMAVSQPKGFPVTERDEPNIAAIVTIGSSPREGTLQDLTHTTSVSIEVWYGNDYAGMDLEITLWRDARIHDVTGFALIGNHHFDGPPMEITESSDQESIELTLPEVADIESAVYINGLFSKPIGQMQGSEAAVGLPGCSVEFSMRECTVSAGTLNYGESVLFVSRPMANPADLSWTDNSSINSITIQMRDETTDKREQAKTFLAGAVIGISGNAGVDLLLLVIGITIAAHRRRTSRISSAQPEATDPEHLQDQNMNSEHADRLEVPTARSFDWVRTVGIVLLSAAALEILAAIRRRHRKRRGA